MVGLVAEPLEIDHLIFLVPTTAIPIKEDDKQEQNKTPLMNFEIIMPSRR